MDEFCKIILIGNKVDLFKVIVYQLVKINKGTINQIHPRTLVSIEI